MRVENPNRNREDSIKDLLEMSTSGRVIGFPIP